MIDTVILKVIGWVLPVVLGPIVYVLADNALNISKSVDDLPPALKRLAVVIMGTVLAAAFSALGLALPPECQAAYDEVCARALGTPSVVQGVVAGLVAMAMHYLRKKPVWRH